MARSLYFASLHEVGRPLLKTADASIDSWKVMSRSRESSIWCFAVCMMLIRELTLHEYV